MKNQSRRFLIIGFGNMGRALARGLQRSGQVELVISDKTPTPSLQELGQMGLHAATTTWLSGPASAGEGALAGIEAVIVATKPQNLAKVAQEWQPLFTQDSLSPLIVSILAGTTTAQIEELFPPGTPVVRAMPNIAATVDHAATVICAGRHATQIHLNTAKGIFDDVGKTWIAPEDQLNAVTGLSGSGPAYIYMVIEALSDGGVKMGLSRQLSLELATQTVIGAGMLVQETKMHPAVLRDQVTTPGGTTISAIHELERHGLRAMLISAVVTATKRSAFILKRAATGSK